MTVSCKISFSTVRYKDRLNLETTLQDFEKSKLLPNVNNPVDRLISADYNRDIGRGF